jgi:hypothetical protein
MVYPSFRSKAGEKGKNPANSFETVCRAFYGRINPKSIVRGITGEGQ